MNDDPILMKFEDDENHHATVWSNDAGLYFMARDRGCDNFVSVRLDRKRVRELRNALNKWLDEPEPVLIQIKDPVREVLHEVLPLYLSRLAQSDDLEPRDVGHAEYRCECTFHMPSFGGNCTACMHLAHGMGECTGTQPECGECGELMEHELNCSVRWMR